MQSVQLAAGTSTEYSRPLASDKTVSLDSERREPYHATAVFPHTFSKKCDLFSKMEGWSRQQNVQAHVVLVLVMQRNQIREDKYKQNYCNLKISGRHSFKRPSASSSLNTFMFFRKEKNVLARLNSYQASLHWGFICVQF